MKNLRFWQRLGLAMLSVSGLCGFAQTQTQPLEQPGAADKALAERFVALASELDQPGGLALEVVNFSRTEKTAAALKTLQSPTPVDAQTLALARRAIAGRVPRLEAARNLTPPAPLLVAQRRGNILIDGKLDEKAWQRAREIPIAFQGLDLSNQPAATARVLWDARYLYVGFWVPDTQILAPIVARDEPVWKNDCVELFLMPEGRFGTYWELEMSPTGSVLDYFCTKFPTQWGSELNTAATLNGLQIGRVVRGTPNQPDDRDEGYTVEVAVPLDQLPGLARGTRGDKIYAILARVNQDTPDGKVWGTALSQIPVAGWFHNIWAYQPLVFK